MRIGSDASRVRRRCRRIVAALDIPEPFEVEGFLARLAAARGRPLELLPVAAGADVPCGLLVSTDSADYIFHPADAVPLHARHIVFHEVGHLLGDHGGGSAAPVLFPDLSPELVRRVLGRTTYSDAQEREAEILATLIARRVLAARRPPRPGLDSIFEG